jgi:hypothetical protein
MHCAPTEKNLYRTVVNLKTGLMRLPCPFPIDRLPICPRAITLSGSDID